MTATPLVLVGAGGHAKAIVEALNAQEFAIEAYVDPQPADWLAARRIDDDEAAIADSAARPFVLGLGGASPDALIRRLALFERYRKAGCPALAVVHPAAQVSPSAQIGDGAIVLAGAVVQPGAVIENAAIVNTGAIVEHDSRLGAGSHLAPGAIFLGAVGVGRCAMIGAGAVVFPDARVPDHGLVRAATRFLSAPMAEAA
jgi:sugar O-acyltransferase (sialic acid O-acetyltransferase NeuD family)